MGSMNPEGTCRRRERGGAIPSYYGIEGFGKFSRRETGKVGWNIPEVRGFRLTWGRRRGEKTGSR